MADKLFIFNLDLNVSTIVPRIRIRQNDLDTNKFSVQILVNGVPADLTGLTVYFECVTPAGNSVRDAATITDAANGKIEYTVSDKAYATIGRINIAYFVFEQTSGSDVLRMSTDNFTFEVIADALTGNPEQGSYNTDIATMLTQVAQLQADYTTLNPANYATTSQLADVALSVTTKGAKGDGVTDDTVAIQSAFDSLASEIVFPKKNNPYIISSTIKVHSHQTINIMSGAEVKLANQSNCIMFQNDSGSEDIHIKGSGAINPNGLNQTRQDNPHGTGTAGTTWFGIAILMWHINNFTWKDVTLKSPTAWGLTLADAHYFEVHNIQLDYGTTPPINTDGVHLCGNCDHFDIDGVYGCTGDDMVPLNADDYGVYAFENGPITNGKINNVVGDNSYRGVRLLSATSLVDQINIDNIRGSYKNSAVLYSNPNGVAGSGNFGDIHIGTINAFETQATEGIIRVNSNVEKIIVDTLIRTQPQITPGMSHKDTIIVSQNYTVARLVVSKFIDKDLTDSGYNSIGIGGNVNCLMITSATHFRNNGANFVGYLVSVGSTGYISDMQLNSINIVNSDCLINNMGTITRTTLTNIIANNLNKFIYSGSGSVLNTVLQSNIFAVNLTGSASYILDGMTIIVFIKSINCNLSGNFASLLNGSSLRMITNDAIVNHTILTPSNGDYVRDTINGSVISIYYDGVAWRKLTDNTTI